MLASVRKKVKALAAPVEEEEVIKALNDINGLWEFMFPGTKSELLRMVLGKIIVFPEQISFVLKAERLKQTSLLRAIQKSRQWTDMLINGEAGNVSDLAEKLGYKPSYVTRILSLNNLAPDIVESILAGTEPEGMSIAKITAQSIPENWNEQRRLYGFPVR